MTRGKRILLIIVLGFVSGVSHSLVVAQETPLHKAAATGDKELVARLLAESAEVNAKDTRGSTPLHLAASRGRKEVAELLLARSADVNATDLYGWTPLHSAAEHGHDAAVERLLAFGADVSAANKARIDALQRAAFLKRLCCMCGPPPLSTALAAAGAARGSLGFACAQVRAHARDVFARARRKARAHTPHVSCSTPMHAAA